MSGNVTNEVWSMRSINKNRDGFSVIAMAEQHLDSITDFASSKLNISKDLKQALLRLPRTKQNHDKLDYDSCDSSRVREVEGAEVYPNGGLRIRG